MLCLMDIAIWANGKKVLTMDEYIRREDAIKCIEDQCTDGKMWGNDEGEGTLIDAYYAIDDLMEIPPADVAPVRHGRWICIRKGYEEYECSVCHGMDSNCSDYYADHVVTEQEYCPFCGAKMDGGAD